jgi:putative membrane protein
MMVIFGLFDKLAYSISDIFKKKTDTRKQSIIFVLKVLIGVAVGLVGFAKILGYTLDHMEAETIFWFMGLILFSVPLVIKKELSGEKFNVIFFLIGALIIGVLEYFNLHGGLMNSNDTDSFLGYSILTGLGVIGGITMIFPGISGSMVMLVLGKYEMIRNLISSITSLDINVFIKLSVFGIGVLFGIVFSSKLLSSLLKKHKGKTVSLILGFVIASALILPLNLETKIVFTTAKVCGLIVSFILGGIVIYYLNKLENKDQD